MAAEIKRDPDLEWIEYVRPVGLVVAPVLLKELGLAPSRQTQADTAIIAAHVGEDSSKPGLKHPWGLFTEVLGWEARHVAGSPGGPELPDDFHVRLLDHDTTLSPTWAVAELGAGNTPWQLLVRIEKPGIDPDARAALEGWEATPHQRFERLLRETGIFVGLLITEKNERKDGEDRYTPELRLIYAPSGETSGHLSFPLHALATVAGRPMLGGLKLLLDSVRLFTDADERRLPALLRKSREAQAAVSTALAEQVLGALHELLRGLHAAEPKLIPELAGARAGHLYEGLLTVLMRLVFILYAEDRDLLPSRLDGRAREIYETSYSARGLYARLVEDAAINPDTMDERRGSWGRLLSLFRLSELRLAGICNIRQLASCLNDRSLQAPSGGPFSYATTRRVLRRLRELHLGPGPRTLGQAARQRAPRPYQYRAGKPMTLSNSSALKKALAQYGGE